MIFDDKTIHTQQALSSLPEAVLWARDTTDADSHSFSERAPQPGAAQFVDFGTIFINAGTIFTFSKRISKNNDPKTTKFLFNRIHRQYPTHGSSNWHNNNLIKHQINIR